MTDRTTLPRAELPGGFTPRHRVNGRHVNGQDHEAPADVDDAPLLNDEGTGYYDMLVAEGYGREEAEAIAGKWSQDCA